ncbi:restriction endonuclease subunit S [Rhodococcus qingshengii]|uniref:restriction endonuclease subunit S n=1 Tax=Rhodococcus qingshengii TaxID=334542 RepID=UPI001BE90054|nr:hypothetical protein [Rhodococcus qingshengii]MBT2273449.1 hypothetical protein [Rhodococcus qingshengii]
MKIEGGAEYQLLGVRWYGEGAFHRETVTRETSKAATVYKVAPGQFIYNRLFAGKGAFGLVLPDFAGAFVSNEFPLFDTDTERLSPGYLNLYFQQKQVWDHVESVSTGTTASRNRWKESQFLAHHLPLPPLPIQARIVEVIRAVDDQITALDVEADSLASVYLAATSLLWLTSEGNEAESRSLGDVMHLDIVRIPMEAGTTYHLAGVRNAGKGLVDKESFDGADTGYTAMNVLRENQVVMRKLTAWEGPITVVPAEFDGFVASNEFPTFTLVCDVAPSWMKHVCRTPRLWAEMQSRVVGTVQRRKRLNPDQLLSVALPVPPRSEQEQAARALEAVEGQVAVVRTEAARLREVRARLLAGLLDHTIDIKFAESEVSRG